MRPDKKYMATDSNDTSDINFVPLKSYYNSEYKLSSLTPFIDMNNSIFNNNYTHNNQFQRAFSNYEMPSSVPISTTNSNVENNSNNNDSYLNLFPSETSESELYSYYNALNKNITNTNTNENSSMRILTPEEILRNFDLDLDENIDLERACCNNDINKIYSEIEKKHPAILSTLSAYKIPYPISRVIIKRLIKLSLNYCSKE
ncbi:hypothetical protein [Clostridium uliginosum]|uniref:Uncharacterized protein n=1 Tax=Clostridium uliginosum TaxID=119641 RepID=A0A1I1RLM1_9CLOT|nr:hypothetical protein [Clostridium uliginosum]SFD33188.1 hypothetical protein SAMN05421842_13314 [Clostridium uliginosum]